METNKRHPDSKIIAQLDEEELAEFTSTQEDEAAIKLIMESATRSAHRIAKEAIIRRNLFWTRLFDKYGLPPNGRYAIDITSGAVMIPLEEDSQ